MDWELAGLMVMVDVRISPVKSLLILLTTDFLGQNV